MHQLLLHILFIAAFFQKPLPSDQGPIQDSLVFVENQSHLSNYLNAQVASTSKHLLQGKKRSRGIEEFPPCVPHLGFKFHSFPSTVVFKSYISPELATSIRRLSVRGPPIVL